MNEEKQSIKKELQEYCYLFDFYEKHYHNNKLMVHPKFVEYLTDKISECAYKLLKLDIQKGFDNK